jgi:mRNA interferase MazF
MGMIKNPVCLSDNYDSEHRILRRGEIYYINLEGVGTGTQFIQQKTRPALIIQNDLGNRNAFTVIIALMTSTYKRGYPFQYIFRFSEDRESVVMFDQIMTIDKTRVLGKIGQLSPKQMKEAEER